MVDTARSYNNKALHNSSKKKSEETYKVEQLRRECVDPHIRMQISKDLNSSRQRDGIFLNATK